MPKIPQCILLPIVNICFKQNQSKKPKETCIWTEDIYSNQHKFHKETEDISGPTLLKHLERSSAFQLVKASEERRLFPLK